MRITRATLHALPFEFVSGGFTTAYGRRTHLNNALLQLETDTGLTGTGEIARKAGNTAEPIAPDMVAGSVHHLERIIGAEPLNLAAVRDALGDVDPAFSNLATATEVACFDLMGQRTSVPLYGLLGGARQASVPEYISISQDTPERMAADAADAREKDLTVFQIKVGGDGEPSVDEGRICAVLDAIGPDHTLLADANGGWDISTACAIIARFDEPRLFWEEPCGTYAENKTVAKESGRPVVLDQCVTGPDITARACADGDVAGIGIKITMQGGLLVGRLSRDLAIAHGLKLKVDDSWGADATTAASLHLALAVPPRNLLCGIDMRPYFSDRVSTTGPTRSAGRVAPGDAPGLGLTPDLSNLGKPLAVV